MDLGRIYCQANKVHCSSCPLSKNCAVVNDDPLIYPKKVKKDQKKEIESAAEDRRLATRHLGGIVGKVDVEEILGSIFQDFCIGK